MIFARQDAALILGEAAALLRHGNGTSTILNGPEDLARVTLQGPLTILLDYPGVITYTTLPFMNLSRFELKAAIRHHPSLQGAEIIGASAQLHAPSSTNKWELTLCALALDAKLRSWIDALLDQKINIKEINAYPFILQAPIHPTDAPPPQALYWVSTTHDNRARHLCYINHRIAFVRYTAKENLGREIDKTHQHIQRDYALSPAEIQVVTPQVDKPLETKMLTLYWSQRLPQTLRQKAEGLKAAQQSQKHQSLFTKITSFGSAIACTMALAGFLQDYTAYREANSHHHTLEQSFQTLPHTLQSLTKAQLDHLVWLATNIGPTPFTALSPLHDANDPRIRFEEIHWVRGREGPKLRVAIVHHPLYTSEDKQAFLQEVFETTIHPLKSDGMVDRFEIRAIP